MSAYQPGIPTGTVDLDQDYLNIQNNFTQINTTYGIDHIPLTEDPGDGNGYHKAVHLMQQVAPAAVDGLGILYTTTVNDGIADDEILYYKTGANKVMQLTRNVVPVAADNGYTFLPGGILLQWGFVGSPGSSGTVFFTTSNINFPNKLFSVQLSLRRSNAGVGSPPSGIAVINSVATFNGTQFSYICSTSGSNRLFWMAIGN